MSEGEKASGARRAPWVSIGALALLALALLAPVYLLPGAARSAGGALSVYPAAVAIGASLFLRRVLWALGIGVALGALLAVDGQLSALPLHLAGYLAHALLDESHAIILTFTLFLGGLMQVVSMAGGAKGLSGLFSKSGGGKRRAQVTTWLMGLVVFFDDYANALLVGTSMRPVVDRLGISREKLAFLVDATAAPVASVALISSWVGVELGYIADQYEAIGLDVNPYAVFVETLPYRFYPFLMLAFGLMVAVSGRDFGPMATSERVAFGRRRPVEPAPTEEREISAPPSSGEDRGDARVALWPLSTLILTAALVLYATGWSAALEAGEEPTLGAVLSHGSSIEAVLVGAAAGIVSAVLTAFRRRRLPLAGLSKAIGAGMAQMLEPCAILILAWSLGEVCRELDTASFLVASLGPWLSPPLLPAAVFLLSAVVSFATGTSWGTMAILFPLVVPLAHGLSPGDEPLLLGAVGSILAGAVWGDHCSPISDTTVLSSLASGCDHGAHVRTQLPYALAVGMISLVIGDLGTGYRIYSPWAALALGALVSWGLLYFLGRPADGVTGPRSGSAA